MDKTTPNLFISLSAIGVVLVILICVVLAALWLPSVFFGLIFAFLLAPLQGFFYRKFFNTRRYEKFAYAVHKLKSKLFFRTLKNDDQIVFNHAFPAKAASHSATGTVIVTILLAMILFLGILGSSIAFVSQIGTEFRERFFSQETLRNYEYTQAMKRVAEEEVTSSSTPSIVNTQPNIDLICLKKTDIQDMLDKFLFRLQDYSKNHVKNEFVRKHISRLIRYLESEEMRHELAQFIADRVSVLFPPLMGVVGTSAKILFDIFMTLVFFTLFLQMIAQYVVKNQALPAMIEEEDSMVMTTHQFSQTLLASAWLPRLSVADNAEVHTTLKEVVVRVKAWLRGYFTIVAIEIPCYILLYSFIGIPNAILFGILSSCVILLPVIGPILVFGSIVIITFATPGVTLAQMVMLLSVIGFMFLIVEMLILYPKIIGERLGLTLVELLVVVLLGGYLFGIVGMFFAIPTASVLKYLIPKIYQSFKH